MPGRVAFSPVTFSANERNQTIREGWPFDWTPPAPCLLTVSCYQSRSQRHAVALAAVRAAIVYRRRRFAALGVRHAG